MGFVPQNISQLSNRHVWTFLRYYLSAASQPKYAVMVDGAWGSGKSHLVTRIVDDHFRGWKDEYVRLSLFGLSNTSEIDDALFAAIYPMLNSAGAHLVHGVMKAGLSYIRASTELRLQKLLSNKKAKVYIFDDLERCELEISKVLGYINTFVEQGARVIIIGDQSRLKVTQTQEALERYSSELEKLVGKTLKVQPSFAEAFGDFVTRTADLETKAFVADNISLIQSIFAQSHSQNLRILQLTLWDFERVFPVLDERHKCNPEAMRSLTALFFAISFEVKQGRLDEYDLATRDDGLAAAMQRHLSKGEKAEVERMEIANKQYSTVNLRDELLPNNVLIDILFKGIIDELAIQEALDRSRFFAQQTKQPAWLRLLHVFDLTDDEFESVLAEIEQQFQDHSITVPGEILHVVSSRLLLAKLGLLSGGVAVVTDECIEYLDALYEAGEIAVSGPSLGHDLGHFGYAGYAFSEASSPEFKRIMRHLQELQSRAKTDHFPEQAQALLVEMTNDVDLFTRRICLTNSSDNKYWNVPLLAEIVPAEFADHLLRLSPTNQGTVLRALNARYELKEAREKQLQPEIEWLARVKAELLRKAVNLPRLSSQRMKMLIEQNLDAFLAEVSAH